MGKKLLFRCSVYKKMGDFEADLRGAIRKAKMRDGLAKGIREVIRAIELGESSVVLLAEDCNHAEYKKLVECMCAQNDVPLVKVQSKMDLGAMCGLVKLDTDGNPVK